MKKWDRGGFSSKKNWCLFLTTPVETKVVVLSGRHGNLTKGSTCEIGIGMVELLLGPLALVVILFTPLAWWSWKQWRK
jgi:hypothetical protein